MIENVSNKRNFRQMTTTLAAYKDDWINNHATSIRVIARKHDLPPDVLAFIAWRELGGDPDNLDDLVFAYRKTVGQLPYTEWLPGMGPAEDTSAGDVSIQLGRVAEQRANRASDMSLGAGLQMTNGLQDDHLSNLESVARYVAEIRNTFWPDQSASAMSDDVRMRLAIAYRYGADVFRKHGGPNRKLFHEDGVTPHTPGRSDINTKRGRMNSLLNTRRHP